MFLKRLELNGFKSFAGKTDLSFPEGITAIVGLAQATLYFDNSSGFFPVDYKEVSISRKVSRDGTSEFSLNKSEIRLKDLVDFLAKVRLGARGLRSEER